MDLKIKDVAELLHVSEKTVRRWLHGGKIPAYRLNHQYRFSRLEIQNWVMSQRIGRDEAGDEPASHPDAGHQSFGLLRAVRRGGVWSGVPASSRDTLIAQSMLQMSPSLDLDAELLTRLLLDREALSPTALGNGIAVPHTRDFVLSGQENAVAVVFPEQPVEYGALDRRAVHTLFFLFATSDKEHLRLLAKIAHFASDPAIAEWLQGTPSSAELLMGIKRWESEQLAASRAHPTHDVTPSSS